MLFPYMEIEIGMEIGINFLSNMEIGMEIISDMEIEIGMEIISDMEIEIEWKLHQKNGNRMEIGINFDMEIKNNYNFFH